MQMEMLREVIGAHGGPEPSRLCGAVGFLMAINMHCKVKARAMLKGREASLLSESA
jgi:hypothetical protein